MSKTVKEVEYKFFLRYTDALDDSNYFLECVDVEGHIPPDQVRSKTVKGNFILKYFTRESSAGKYIEKAYLQIN